MAGRQYASPFLLREACLHSYCEHMSRAMAASKPKLLTGDELRELHLHFRSLIADVDFNCHPQLDDRFPQHWVALAEAELLDRIDEEFETIRVKNEVAGRHLEQLHHQAASVQHSNSKAVDLHAWLWGIPWGPWALQDAEEREERVLLEQTSSRARVSELHGEMSGRDSERGGHVQRSLEPEEAAAAIVSAGCQHTEQDGADSRSDDGEFVLVSHEEIEYEFVSHEDCSFSYMMHGSWGSSGALQRARPSRSVRYKGFLGMPFWLEVFVVVGVIISAFVIGVSPLILLADLSKSNVSKIKQKLISVFSKNKK